MTAHVIRGDARHLPLPDESVDLIVTSPPFYGLRSYQDGGEHYDGQIGAEPSIAEYLDVMLTATAEWIRVLKPSGSLFVNLGDKYANRSGVGWGRTSVINGRHGRPEMIRNSTPHVRPDTSRANGIPEKSLMGVPWRYALGCVDELGLILRQELVWSKPNGLPESVGDRARRSHETWFHFTLERHYFSALDELRELAVTADRRGPRRSYPAGSASSIAADGEHVRMLGPFAGLPLNPLGRLPGSVWNVPTEPLLAPDVSPLDGRPLPDHFAAFPTEWPRRLILGWSPAGICTSCGDGRRPVVAPDFIVGYACACTPRTSNVGQRGDWREGRQENPELLNEFDTGSGNAVPRRPGGFGTKIPAPDVPAVTYHFEGWDPAPTRPAVVLDPFGGTGTVALMADVLGRTGVSVDLSHDYGRLARWRTTDRGERARAMRVEKPPVQVKDQASLW